MAPFFYGDRMKKLMEKQLWNGNRTRVFSDGNELVAEDVKPAGQVQAILDSNAELRNHAVINKQARGRLVARIPDTMHREWKKEWKNKYSQDWTWKTYLSMKLNSRENSYLKLINGKI
tara:strand:- start:65 stop:418 length:354 start_codon:yes stop_codon:yes gene_type:complete